LQTRPLAEYAKRPNTELHSSQSSPQGGKGRGMGMDDMDEELELKCKGDKKGDKKETAHIRQAKVELVAE